MDVGAQRAVEVNVHARSSRHPPVLMGRWWTSALEGGRRLAQVFSSTPELTIIGWSETLLVYYMNDF